MKKINQNHFCFKNNIRGFTLIEMLVAVFMFSVVMAVASGFFAKTMVLQRRLFLMQQVQENVNFVLESMAREIRVGHICELQTLCQSGTVLNLEHPVNGSIQYSLLGDQVQRIEDGTATIISSSAVKFTRLNFLISGIENFDGKQPRVTIILRARATSGDQFSEINAQTTVSPRFLSDDFRFP